MGLLQRCARRVLASVWFALPAVGGADAPPIAEHTQAVDVHVQSAAGLAVNRTIEVSILREVRTHRQPFLILNHGRGADAAERARLALPIYPANARYFAHRGFVVLVPLRVGYGLSGGPDLEYTGDCAFKRFADGVAPAVAQTRRMVDFARTLPFVDAAHGLIVGESFGGLVAIAAASGPIAGVGAVINISGGDGGDSLRRADQPCRPDQMRATFARYGRTSRVPSLWLYSANDRLWGPRYPKDWFAAFIGAGGAGNFVALPADKNNGHFIFNRNAEAWHPAFEGFVAGLGPAYSSR